MIAVLNSAAGAYYYLRIVVTMYLRTPTADALTSHPAWPSALVVTLCAIGTVVVGIYPTPVLVATRQAAEAAIELPEPSGTTGTVAVTVGPTSR